MGRDKSHKKRRHRDDSEDESSEDVSSSEDSSITASSSTEESSHDERRKSKKRKHSSSDRKHKSRKKSSRKKTKKEKKPHKLKVNKISEDDYFLKSSEFRHWLSKERGVYFSDLSSVESRKYFKKFVKKWNVGQLKKEYYDGIESSSLIHNTQTSYKWKLSHKGDELGSIRDQVSSWTAGQHDDTKPPAKRVIGPCMGPGIGPGISPGMGPGISSGMGSEGSSNKRDPFEEEERRERERERIKAERRDLRKHNEMVMDELLPKATGFAAKLEKKRARAEQRRDREISPDMNDSSLMGPTTNFQAKLKAREEGRQQKVHAASQKISDYEAREKARVAAILEMAKANKKEGALW